MGKVTLYSGDDFDGTSWEFDTLGDYAAVLGDFKNDVVSSIIIEGDFSATVYVHCPKELDSVQREDLMRLEAFCLNAGGESMTLTAGRYVGSSMGIPINTMSYLRVQEASEDSGETTRPPVENPAKPAPVCLDFTSSKSCKKKARKTGLKCKWNKKKERCDAAKKNKKDKKKKNKTNKEE